MALLIDITGQKFGRLTVTAVAKRASPGKPGTVWECLCDCGQITKAVAGNLKNGHTKSCGCLQRELNAERHTTHGRSGTPTYTSWYSMKSRCTNPNTDSYKYYGAKGVKVCSRWLEFENFLEDMGERPSRDYCLSRKKDSGNYEPGNVTWALKSVNIAESNRKRKSKCGG